jgi:hypothetical protein
MIRPPFGGPIAPVVIGQADFNRGELFEYSIAIGYRCQNFDVSVFRDAVDFTVERTAALIKTERESA